MLIRVAGITQDSIVDGPGLRLVIFTQGCPHDCPGCHNPETHRFDGGRLMDTSEIIAMMDNNPLLSGITLTGGEPFCQAAICAELAWAAQKRGLSVWTYTGYTYEHILERIIYGRSHCGPMRLLSATDVLVDGPYIEELRSLDIRFRGSRNQRLVNVKQSLSENRIIEWSEKDVQKSRGDK